MNHEPGNDIRRCDACGFYNEIESTHNGGEFVPKSTSVSDTENTEDPSGSCPFCYTPDPFAGARISWGKRGRF
jgi:hypothetical protein